jgi:hypothetical protein
MVHFRHPRLVAVEQNTFGQKLGADTLVLRPHGNQLGGQSVECSGVRA